MKFATIDMTEAHANDYVVYKNGTRSLLDSDDIAHIRKYGWPEAVIPQETDHYERMLPEPVPGIFRQDGNYYAWDGKDAALIAVVQEGVATTEPEPCTSETLIVKGYEQIIELSDIQDTTLEETNE